MPLLHRKLFTPISPPSDLDPDEEVFHCPLTNEIFRNYEDFYERTILCNSLVWSCSITERPNLTYQEALDCEETAKKKLSKVSHSILKPILYLVGLSKYSRVDDLNEELYNFVRDRFFVGEIVEVQLQKKKMKQAGRVMQVLPSKESMLNGHSSSRKDSDSSDSDTDDEDDIPLSTFKPVKPLDPSQIRYIIRMQDGTQAHVTRAFVRRKQGVYNRQCSKLYLKGNCYKPQGQATDIYVVKEHVKRKLGLDQMKWEEIFTGPKPFFSPTKTGKRKANSNDSAKTKSDREKNREEKELRLAREQEKRKSKEELKKKKAEELEKVKEAARLDKERKKKEREEEMMKLKVEREQIRQQKNEEKKRLAEYLKEWSRPRDDLECDDLQDLPVPQEIVSPLSPSLFGKALTLLEFFNAFGHMYDAADEFPGGVTIDSLARALTEHDHDGPFCDLLFFFLSNLFRTQAEEEEGSETVHTEASDLELAQSLNERVSEDTLQAFSTLILSWPITYQGFPLQKLELDSYTVSEILRLYLLSSAARPRSEDRLWRLQQRGGYSVTDDTPISFCLHHPDLAHKLSTVSVFDFTPDEKSDILMCLLHHLLSFVVPRDHLDEAGEKLQQAQQAYRDDRAAEKKREKELALEKSKFKCQQLNLEKKARLKEFEDNLKKEESGRTKMSINEAVIKIEDEDDDEEEDDDEDEDKPKLLNPLERAERLRIYDEEETHAKEAWQFRHQKHLLTINKQRISFRISSIGQDRYFRRYWNIASFPGVFVEEFPDENLTEDLLSVKVPQKSFSIPSASGYSTPGVASDCSTAGTPNGTLSSTNYPSNPACRIALSTVASPVNGVLAPSDCSPLLKQATSSSMTLSKSDGPRINSDEERPLSENMVQGKQYRWSVYQSIDEIENLIAALNTRGYRESKLRNNLSAIKEVILHKLTSSKRQLNQLLEINGKSKKYSNEKRESKIENLLRDQILDLEGRIWSGTLGIVKVENRVSWRESIQFSTIYDGAVNEDTSLPHIEGEDEETVCDPVVSFPIPCKINSKDVNDDDVTYTSDSFHPETKQSDVIKQLATALLIVERAVDRKYLKNPLGWAVDARKGARSRSTTDTVDEEEKRKCELLLRRWESSLLSCTSLSQIFLHLSTLERSITWSRSILNAKCRICRRKGDGEKMLLCDSCDRGHHMYCLRPAIKNVPAGDWFCPDCRPKSAKISPRKVIRTKSFAQDESSSEEEDSEDDNDDVEMDEEDEDSYEEVEEPVKKRLTYKIPSRSRKNTVAVSGRVSEKRKRRSSGKVNIGSSKRRSAGVWKDLNACEEILSEMIKHKDSWPFLDPVSRKLVPDYYSIIKKPMDLGTVLRKLKNVQYSSPSDFVDDVDLIFQNCHEYNDPRSNIAKTANNLRSFFDSKLEDRGLENYRLSVSNKSKKRKTF